jgi:hypothetical protein
LRLPSGCFGSTMSATSRCRLSVRRNELAVAICETQTGIKSPLLRQTASRDLRRLQADAGCLLK